MAIESKIKKQVPLADLTTFKIGGPAEFFAEVKTRQELEEIGEWARQQELEIFFLGGGSNILVSDDGFDGLVVKFGNKDLEIKEERVVCGSGADLSRVLQEALDQGLSGLEWAAGIPGITLGGAIRGNAGAFGASMSDVVSSVRAYDLSEKKWLQFNSGECEFGYRESIFKNKGDLVIWQAELELDRGERSVIKETIKKNIEKRSACQPRDPSAGSVFKNFTLKYLREYAPSLADRARYEGVVKGEKVGAGWVIDKLDLRGKKIGGAQVSEEHANFIINSGDATALDVITLVSYIKQKVRQEFNLQLREEIQYVGF